MQGATTIANAVLVAAVLIGAYSDVRWRRLPNWVTLGSALLGSGIQLAARGLDGGRDSLLGWLVGCALLFLPFAFGVMGAGDVKLLGAVGALRGPSFVISAAFYMAMVGGVFAVVVLVQRRALWPLITNVANALWLTLRSMASYRSLSPVMAIGTQLGSAQTGSIGATIGDGKALTLPYGMAIAAGGLLALVLMP